MAKVFTSLSLVDMVQRGKLALTDPVSKYVPPNVKVPELGKRKIALPGLFGPKFPSAAGAVEFQP